MNRSALAMATICGSMFALIMTPANLTTSARIAAYAASAVTVVITFIALDRRKHKP